jgi:hypothetical protein
VHVLLVQSGILASSSVVLWLLLAAGHEATCASETVATVGSGNACCVQLQTTTMASCGSNCEASDPTCWCLIIRSVESRLPEGTIW